MFTSYTTNSEGNTVTEETGDGVSHKFYSTEDENVEIIGDKTKKTKTASDENQNKTYWTVSDDIYSTYLKNTDKFGRTTSESLYKTELDTEGKEIESLNDEVYNKEYSYHSAGENKTTESVSRLTYTGGYDKTINYGYDKNGNITTAGNIWYQYDEAGQLKTEVDVTCGTGKDYIYDAGGNIAEVRHFTNGEYGETDTYTYGDKNWKDLLTEYNGNEITYDEIGNPLTYYNGTEFSWTMGRRLESAVKSDGTAIAYTYNADGLRTSKTICDTTSETLDEVKYNYYWNGDKLTTQTCGENTLYFRYDGETPIGFEYNDEQYYYVTNLQGDIIAILNSSGNCVAEYSYDAWGNCTIVSDTDGIAEINPLRYRGYYFDSDTDMYYLQSRYYDAGIGRFINADDVENLKDDKDINAPYNIFTYCCNNPIIFYDQSGTSALVIAGVGVSSIIEGLKIVSALVGSVIVGYTAGNKIAQIRKASISKSMPKLKTKVQIKIGNKRKKIDLVKYYTADIIKVDGKPVIYIGKEITKAKAVQRIRSGFSTFTFFKHNAKQITSLACGNTPVLDDIHKAEPGYLPHYHVYKRKNKAHSFFMQF